jgi:D-amino-acid oxidase
VAEVLVVGAGVSGLTSALLLAQAGHDVRVRTAAPPQETTSRVAGAMWGSTFAGPQDRVGGWAFRSLEEFRTLAEVPGSGVAFTSGTLASSNGQPPPPGLFPGVDVEPAEAPDGFAGGFRVTVPLIDMPAHLDHLVARLAAAGVPIEVAPVDALDEAPVVVNCAGLGARELVPDPSVRAMRGQHVVVANPGIDEFFMAEPFGETWVSFFPHGDRVVVGSVAQPGDEDTEPRAADAQRMLAAAAKIEPRLADVPVVEHQVGLRPMRDDVRVEAEQRGATRVIHNYGHGGTGVGLSWGCAADVVALAAG